MLNGKKIILGITGSIAAYKACYIIRGLIKQGAEVQVVITPAGKEFITPITLSALTGKPVISEFFAQRDGTWNSHVDLGLWADAMLIAPATASTIGKMANGIADNMLITTYLSAKAPVFVAPAMDLDMFAHPSTQKNLDTLRSYGNHIIEPASGELASHLVGKGRMEEPENIIRVLDEFFSSTGELAGKKVLITAGPTYEKIDPVRFIGNDDHIAPRCQHGVFVALFRGKLLNRSENDAPGIAVEEPLEIFATLRLYRRLPNQIMAHGERGKELIIKIIAVGKNHNRGILHGGMQDEPPGIKSHEQTLSRSLRMPDDPCALIALRQRRLYRTIHGMANGMELMIPRQNFDESVFLHKNRTIADKLQKTPPFKNTFRQHGEFGHPLGSYG